MNDTNSTIKSKDNSLPKKKKFRSSLSYAPDEIENILKMKINDENTFAKEHSTQQSLEDENKLLSKINYIKGIINIVSLFSGAGGLDLGVELSNMVLQNTEKDAYKLLSNEKKYKKNREKLVKKYIYSNDLFEAANQTYVSNFSDRVVKDSRNIKKIITFPKSNLMLGGFPCPGFSAAGPRLLDDPRNFLYIHYIRALMQSKPAFFIAENVKGIMTMANGQVLKQITEDFSIAGYQVNTHLVNARDYGVPQLRDRVFIIGVRNDVVENYGFEYILPIATHGPAAIPYVTLKNAIGDLPLDPDDVFDSDYSSMYMSRNRKKTWNDQSFTIQASGRQAPQHPAGEPMKRISSDIWIFQGNINRRLSVRECARVQTFPDWFQFSKGDNKKTSRNNQLNQQYKQIGNAVPVILAEKISRPIINFLINHPELLT